MRANEKKLISFDYAIKYLLKDKGDYDIIEGFISTIIGTSGYPSVHIKALLESASNREEDFSRSSIADLIVEDTNGDKYIVEIDRSYASYFLHKACFSSSRLIIDSISQGESYSKIKKVIHINLIYDSFGRLNTPLHHGKVIFHEINTDTPEDICLMKSEQQFFKLNNIFPEYFVISIPLFDGIVKNEMDELLYVLKNEELKEDFTSPYMKKIAKRLNYLKMDDAARNAYQAYLMKLTKEEDRYASAVEKGEARGIEKGVEKGIEKGIEIGEASGIEKGIEIGAAKEKMEIAMQLLSLGQDLEFICKATGLSMNVLMELQQKI